MPQWLFTVYSAMRPRLHAEEQLNMLSLLQAAGGRTTKDDVVSSFVKELERQATGWKSDPRRQRPSSLDDLAAMGIKVERS